MTRSLLLLDEEMDLDYGRKERVFTGGIARGWLGYFGGYLRFWEKE